MSIYSDYDKVKKVINSCLTYDQVISAYWFMRSFDKKYPNESSLGVIKTDLRVTYNTKSNELANPQAIQTTLP